MPLKIQYVSDLHLEFRSKTQIPKIIKPTGADVLILAGDICAMGTAEDFDRFVLFLDTFASQYKYLFHVAGNHEYYNNISHRVELTKENTMQFINRKLKNLKKKYTNYNYLDCDTFVIQHNRTQYMFIGASLWSFVNPEDRSNIQSCMNDYNSIYVANNGIAKYTIEDMTKLHKKHLAFIKRSVKFASEQNIKSILITHHKPVGDTPENEKNKYTQAYETDITAEIKPPVILAVHGHTHSSYNKIINKVRYVSNPLGYIREKTGFQDDLTITV